MSTPTPAPVVIADKATVVAAEITDQFLVEGNDAYCLTSPCGRSGTLKEPGRHVLTLRQDSAMLKIDDQRSAVPRPMVLRQAIYRNMNFLYIALEGYGGKWTRAAVNRALGHLIENKCFSKRSTSEYYRKWFDIPSM